MDKKDLLEVRKLFSKSKSRVSTIAGVYISPDHTVLSSFTRTAAAMDEDTADMLTALAAKGMSGKLFRNQMPVEFPMEEEKEGGRQERLNRLLKSGLSDKQEILDFCNNLELPFEDNLLILFTYGVYDVPKKAKDQTTLADSDLVYSFLHIDFCPVEERKRCPVFDASSGMFVPSVSEPEAKAPICGLLYPAFSDRCPDIHSALYYSKSIKDRHPEIVEMLTGADTLPLDEAQQKSVFKETVEEALGRECNFESVRDASLAIGDLAKENPEAAKETGPAEIKRILLDTSAGKRKQSEIDQAVSDSLQDGQTLNAELVSAGSKMVIASPDVIISVRRETAGLLETGVVDGRECILIPIADGLTVDGIHVLPSQTNA